MKYGTSKSRIRCGRCKFFEHLKTFHSGNQEGQCMRFPPKETPQGALFPRVTDLYCWCGEFKKKK